MARIAAAVSLCVLAAGCRTAVRGDLDERAANELVVALDAAAIPAVKLQDGRRGRFRVEVPRDQAAAALGLIEERGLPTPAQPGYEALLGASGLVTTPAEARARWMIATAGELARTLEAIDGVQTARVHLDPGPADRALDETAPPLRAVVLLRRAPRHAAIDEDLVRRLVAGAVGGAEASSIEVLQTEATATPAGDGGSAARDAARLRLLLGGALATNAALALALAVMLWRRRRDHPPA